MKKAGSLAVIVVLVLMVSAASAGANKISVKVTTSSYPDMNSVSFNATENGTAKENVEIYIDGMLFGATDSSGIHVEEGIPEGTHEWYAKYRGAIYDSGSFVFFNYTVTAKGTYTGGEPWSAKETGNASVSSQDIDKLLFRSSLAAPVGNTTYHATISVDGTAYDADKTSDIGIAKGHNVMAWMVGNEMHATMKAASERDHLFDYGIPAKGTASPPQPFNYVITAKGTQPEYSYDEHYEKAEVKDFGLFEKKEERKWFHIDHTQTVRTHYDCSLNGGSWVSWAESDTRNVNPWKGEYQTLTPGDWYIYAGGESFLWFAPYCRVEIWYKSRYAVNVPWSAPEKGSGFVNTNEGFKYITTSGLVAPNKDTSWSVEDDNLQVNTQMDGPKLYANTQYTAPWSDIKAGNGSVNSSELVKLVDTYNKPFPPYTDIERTVYLPPSITVNKTTYKDFNGDSRVESGGFNAWVSDRSLYASVGYLPPVASIDSISPKFSLEGEKVSFSGHGEPGENPGGISPVTAYRWRSSKDGILSSEPNFSTSSLSPANHVIFFKVEDTDAIWSPEAIDALRVNRPPVAYISLINGTGNDVNGETVAALGDPIRFVGVGIDTDGYISEYIWSSNRDGLLSNEPEFTTRGLSEGTHILSFRVKDNDGAWSKEIKTKIKVTRLPVLLVHGYLASPDSMNKLKYELEKDGFNVYRIDLRRTTSVNIKAAYEFASSTQEPIENLKNLNEISRDFGNDFTSAFNNEVKQAIIDEAWKKIEQLFENPEKKISKMEKSLNDLEQSSNPDQLKASKDFINQLKNRIETIKKIINDMKNGIEKDYAVLLPQIEGLEKDMEHLNNNYPLYLQIGSGDIGISTELVGDIPVPIILPDLKVPFLKKKVVELAEQYLLKGKGITIGTLSKDRVIDGWKIKVEGDINAKNIHFDDEQKNIIFDIYLENLRVTGEGKITGIFNPSGKVMEFMDQLENNGFASSIGLRIENLFSGKPRFVIKLSTSLPFLNLDLANSDIKGYAGDIGERIDEIKKETGLPRVDIVGHNMGAVASRWYVNYGYKNDVRKLIMLGSPNHGSDVALYGPQVAKFLISTLASLLGPIGGVLGDVANSALDYVLGDAIRQMETHSSFIYELNANEKCAPSFWIGKGLSEHDDKVNTHVQHDVIAGKVAFWLPTTLSHGHIVSDLLLAKINFVVPWIDDGDILVTTESARIDNIPMEEVNNWNLDLIEKSEPITKVKDFLYDDPPPAGPVDEISSTMAQASQWFDPIEGKIFTNETKTHSITIDNTTTGVTFTLQWLGKDSDLDLTLVSPGGETITPLSADNKTIIYSRINNYIVYNIKDSSPEEWMMKITGKDTPADGAKYYAFVTYNTRLFTGIATDKYQYKPNETIRIYAYVQDSGSPLAGASVVAEVRKPDTKIDTISLYDDGLHQDGNASDGIYASIFNSTSLFGAYDITANATLTKDGKQYHRVAGTTIWIETNPDLTLNSSDISFSKNVPIHGENITIKALIHNTGDQNVSDARIIFYDGDPAGDGILIGNDFIDISAGDAVEAFVPWNANYGNRTIHVIIDPFGRFLEKDYTNNRANRTISVGDPISPDADAGPDQTATVNTTVFLDGSGSRDNVNIMNYSWDVDTSTDSNGDGIPGNDVDLTGVNPVYSGYDHAGIYTVKLIAKDAAGNAGSDTMRVTVTTEYDLEYPVADAGRDQIITAGEEVTFNGGGSEDNFGIITYFWDIDTSIDTDGDGIPDNDIDLTGVNPTFKSGYPASGMYTVRLTVDDAAGNGPVTDTMTVTVKTKPDLFIYPEDIISIPSAPTLNQEVKTKVVIRNSGETDVKDARIEFRLNDALKDIKTTSVAGDSSVTVTFRWTVGARGMNTLNIKLDPDNRIDEEYEDNNEISTRIIVNRPPVAGAGGPYVFYEGSPATFNGSGSYDPDENIFLYEWDLDGDGIYEIGTYGADGTVNHTWYDDYSGNISLRVTDSFGESDMGYTNVTVLNVPPTADAGKNQTVTAGDPIIFNGNATDPGLDNLTFRWEFGDGTNATGINTTHVYFDKGNYTAILIVTDDDGGIGTDTAVITVKPILVNVTIEPETLNLKSGGYFTAFIDLPESHSVKDINISTVECEGANATSGQIADSGKYIAKFNREDMRDDLPTGEAVELTVTGKVVYNGGEADFEGSDTIRVVASRKGS